MACCQHDTPVHPHLAHSGRCARTVKLSQQTNSDQTILKYANDLAYPQLPFEYSRSHSRTASLAHIQPPFKYRVPIGGRLNSAQSIIDIPSSKW